MIGGGIGIASAWVISGLFRSVLFGLEPTAALAYALPAALIVLGGGLTAWIASSRAARIGRPIALRSE